jgi:hypothetical protein
MAARAAAAASRAAGDDSGIDTGWALVIVGADSAGRDARSRFRTKAIPSSTAIAAAQPR